MGHLLVFLLLSVLHPFYVSVTTIDYKTENKKLEISCRIFFDDLEKALDKKYGKSFSLLKPKDQKELDHYLADYLQQNLLIYADGKPCSLHYIGHEIEEDAAWCYFQSDSIPSITQLSVQNSILYASHEQQSNILHVTVNQTRKSLKLDNPKTKATFKFN